jgi:hypothetical protein
VVQQALTLQLVFSDSEQNAVLVCGDFLCVCEDGLMPVAEQVLASDALFAQLMGVMPDRATGMPFTFPLSFSVW